jgi:cyclopropane-fatty-acyl-phospholipid synthase
MGGLEERIMLYRGIDWAERGRVPDFVIRQGIRRLLRQRLTQIAARDEAALRQSLARVVAKMDAGPVAPVPEKANEQHYEVPAEFFELVLGPHLKYSSALWNPGTASLGEAEGAMLELTARRAALADGQRILELGCGWGSLTLWMAQALPAARIVAVSNSASQREFILARARQRQLSNVSVVTADMNAFEPGATFDRVVSVEMFEHMRGWRRLLKRVGSWLEPEGKAFLHVFCHRQVPYFFEEEGAGNWLGRTFFSGGLMPSEQLIDEFQEALTVEKRWTVPGHHYARTARAWLEALDRRRQEVLPVLARVYGGGEARRWLGRWRLFFLACEELFGYDEGRQWRVAHTLLRKAS